MDVIFELEYDFVHGRAAVITFYITEYFVRNLDSRVILEFGQLRPIFTFVKDPILYSCVDCLMQSAGYL